ncbi:phage minor head protein [Nonomuraea sp. NPDC050790]|uniref:phage minor head protein n=1 Tax=Nonomuraea sp. NPDC050790 TaxID=3364371 RepID=UPI0037AA66D2
MAITSETLRLVASLRNQINSITDNTVRSLTVAWVRAWDEIVWEVIAALDELLRASNDGWPSRRQIARTARAMSALDLAREALERLAGLAIQSITASVAEAARLSAAGQNDLIASQLPPGSRRQLDIRFGRADQDPLAVIITRTTQRITSYVRPISKDATAAMKRELVRGVAVGDNPRESARRILQRVEGAFNGGLSRAATIARTEILDASRKAAEWSQEPHDDVLDGWVWNASLDPRVCPACLSMHGTQHPLSEPGPQGHPNCRCARTPKTKSWSDLGFGIPEPDDLLPDARSWFDALPTVDQQQIMGRARLDSLNRGDLDWADLAIKRENPDWRASYQVRPLKGLSHLHKRAA